jgi:hypothetical protein
MCVATTTHSAGFQPSTQPRTIWEMTEGRLIGATEIDLERNLLAFDLGRVNIEGALRRERTIYPEQKRMCLRRRITVIMLSMSEKT